MDVEAGQDAPKKEPRTYCQSVKDIVMAHALVFILIHALILGIFVGLLLRLRSQPYSVRELLYLRFPGELLMNMLKFIILPLIVSSIISGMNSLDIKTSGKLGLRTLLYYLTTTLSSVILGIILVLIIEPGKKGERPEKEQTNFRKVEASDTFMDLIRQLFPSNMVEATFQKTLTVLTEKKPKNDTMDDEEPELVPALKAVRGMNMLGVVSMSVAAGIAINHMGDRGAPLKTMFDAIMDLTIVLIHVVIWYSPVGVMFLVVNELVSIDNPMQVFNQLSFYCITVMLGLAVHGFVCLPILYFTVCRHNPYRFMHGVMQAMITAVGTASSSATMPVTMSNLEENNHVDPRVVGFVIPLGATINMDGTALYEAVAVIFIAQLEGVDFGFSEVIVVCLTATMAAIGAAGVPQAGLVTMVIVLTAVGLPADRVGLILSIDWLLDRFRTAINVLGDAYGAGIVNKLCLRDLPPNASGDQHLNGEQPQLEASATPATVTVEAEGAAPSPASTSGNQDLHSPDVPGQQHIPPGRGASVTI